MNVKAIYNPRKPNGDMSDVACDGCGCIGAAYVIVMDKKICKGCLENWCTLIDKSILQDVMDSVERRRRKDA